MGGEAPQGASSGGNGAGMAQGGKGAEKGAGHKGEREGETEEGGFCSSLLSCFRHGKEADVGTKGSERLAEPQLQPRQDSRGMAVEMLWDPLVQAALAPRQPHCIPQGPFVHP